MLQAGPVEGNNRRGAFQIVALSWRIRRFRRNAGRPVFQAMIISRWRFCRSAVLPNGKTDMLEYTLSKKILSIQKKCYTFATLLQI
jgi:hypothetical protein